MVSSFKGINLPLVYIFFTDIVFSDNAPVLFINTIDALANFSITDIFLKTMPSFFIFLIIINELNIIIKISVIGIYESINMELFLIIICKSLPIT